jgi:ADP-ribosylglycohydrolase
LIIPPTAPTQQEKRSIETLKKALEEIKGRRPQGPRRLRLQLSDEHLLDRVKGGWLGRCIGCLLGKPVERWTKKMVEEYLRAGKAYPLDNYFPFLREGVPKYLLFPPGQVEWTLGSIRKMVRDDDIDYTIMALHILEENGFGFTTKDVGDQWLNHFPYNSLFTAERVAYKNLVNGILPPETATTNNPFNEWIGAQIRADLWGYVSPRMPEIAAEFAFRDAALSHVKEGVYGAMFFSSLIAAAFSTSNIEQLIRIGLSEIPAECEFAEMTKKVLAWSKESRDWEEIWKMIDARYGKLPQLHTINNAAFVLLALIRGDRDFEKSVARAVMAGSDTDCNGATAGSIMGVILGAERIPEKWSNPLNDIIESDIVEFNSNSISKLAERTHTLARSNLSRE